LNTIKARKEKYPFSYTPSQQGEKLKPQEVVKELNVQAEALGSKSRVFYQS
jgi:acetolactate synthase-1/2/3 large subunit